LFDHLLENFKTDFDIDLNNYKDDVEMDKKMKAKSKLREKCLKTMRALSDVENILITIEKFYDDVDYLKLITRQKFEDLNRNLLEKIKKSLLECLKGASLCSEQIDDVIVVGGCSKIPLIQNIISDIFKKSEVFKYLDIEEVVSVGAALEAAKMFKVIEVTPYSLGVRTKKTETGVIQFAEILKKNIPIPASNIQFFQTADDNQTEARIRIYERVSESESLEDNNLLGEFRITEIQKLSAGLAEINVTFTIDKNGILMVTAEDAKNPSNKNSIEINYGKGKFYKM
jgi:molecular chaperone DnaK (HSP70)